MQNIEIKAKAENLATLHHLAQHLPADFQWTRSQIDTYFSVPKGKLKLRQESDQPAVLIAYHRPNVKSPKLSNYALYTTQEADQLLHILGSVLNRDVCVEKQRTLYLWKNIRIHLDQVAQLGDFIEFEAVLANSDMAQESHSDVQYLLDYFNIAPHELIDVGYYELLKNAL